MMMRGLFGGAFASILSNTSSLIPPNAERWGAQRERVRVRLPPTTAIQNARFGPRFGKHSRVPCRTPPSAQRRSYVEASGSSDTDDFLDTPIASNFWPLWTLVPRQKKIQTPAKIDSQQSIFSFLTTSSPLNGPHLGNYVT
jgi:hypothetical protein